MFAMWGDVGDRRVRHGFRRSHRAKPFLLG